jgi:peptidoglycan/LPS O-acetylase OafA/YrhL
MDFKDRAYRPDINGLRAVAVLAVLAFHFKLPGFDGGFAGVDVFFVISGYLMTQIILAGLEAGRFSLWQFFGARLRRIWPALLVMCSFVLAIGFFRLSPPDYETNARHVLSSLVFLSNFDYLMRASYFDALGSENWLLHTWSLSIEFQFYLIYPVILVALYRWRGRPGSLVQWAAGLFAVSYLLSALPTRIQPFPAFYVLPTRAWEMLGGALVCIAPQQLARWAPRKGLLLPVGAALILLAITVFSPAIKWPGRLAMVPVLGAMLMLLANDQQSWLARSRVLQFFGTASYSIYLWHWPLIGFVNQLPLEPVSRVGLGVTLSLVMGWLSYIAVEVPGRRWLKKPRLLSGLLFLVPVAMATAIVAILATTGAGFPGREAVRQYARLKNDVRYVHIDEGWCFADNRTLNIPYRAELSRCDIGDLQGNRTALLWGDSHAGHFTPFVNELAKAAHVKLRVLGTPECWPTLQGEKLGINPQVCAHFRDDVARTAKDFDVIILAARWDSDSRAHWQDDVRYTLDSLAATGKKIIVLRQVPLFEADIARQYIYDGLFGYPQRTSYPRVLASDLQNAKVRDMVSSTPHAQFIDVTASLCTPDGGNCQVLQNGTMMYSDEQHLSVPGAILLGQQTIKAGQNFLP